MAEKYRHGLGFVLLIVVILLSGCAATGDTGAVPAITPTPKEPVQGQNPQAQEPATEVVQKVEVYPQGLVLAGVSKDMTGYGYWLKQADNSVLMTPAQIEGFNRDIRSKVSSVQDLLAYKDSLSKAELAGYINAYKLPVKTMYNDQGKAIGESFLVLLKQNVNLAGIAASNPVDWGEKRSCSRISRER